ncbi:MAG: hypothetical protein ABL971_10170 [Vicinamibacterales bacterium]
MPILRAFLRDERASDLVEYALLTAFVGTAGAVALAAFPGIINTVYTSWDTATQAIWEPRDPS